MVESRTKIFWSWQSDYSPKTCRNFIRAALQTAISNLATETGVDDADRPEIDHDTRGERGMVDITTTILGKIANAAVFVADLTPIARSDVGKWLPNPNVMIELGWAMHKPGWQRVIGVLNTACGAKVEDLPFDIRQRRIITFEFREDDDKPKRSMVREKLIGDLQQALSVNLEEREEDVAAAKEIAGVAAKPNNFSIWSTANDILLHNNTFGEDGQSKIHIPDVPRSYIRVIPAGWNTHPPLVSDIARLRDDIAVNAPTDGCREGDFGPTSEGYVRYWITDHTAEREPVSSNMAMYFDDTGEFWILHGSVIVKHNSRLMLKHEAMLGRWSMALRNAMRVMDRFGAQKLRRVEVGLFGASDLKWYSDWTRDAVPSRRNEVRENRQSANWNDAAQIKFLNDSYNRVRNLFALERVTEAKVIEILQKEHPERFSVDAP